MFEVKYSRSPFRLWEMSTSDNRWPSAHEPVAQLWSELYRCSTTWGQNTQKPWALKLGKVKHWIRGTVSFFASHSWPVTLGCSFQIKTVTSTYSLHFWNLAGISLLESLLCLSQTPAVSRQLSWSFAFLLQSKMQLNWGVLAVPFSKEILFLSQQLALPNEYCAVSSLISSLWCISTSGWVQDLGVRSTGIIGIQQFWLRAFFNPVEHAVSHPEKWGGFVPGVLTRLPTTICSVLSHAPLVQLAPTEASGSSTIWRNKVKAQIAWPACTRSSSPARYDILAQPLKIRPPQLASWVQKEEKTGLYSVKTF